MGLARRSLEPRLLLFEEAYSIWRELRLTLVDRVLPHWVWQMFALFGCQCQQCSCLGRAGDGSGVVRPSPSRLREGVTGTRNPRRFSLGSRFIRALAIELIREES